MSSAKHDFPKETQSCPVRIVNPMPTGAEMGQWGEPGHQGEQSRVRFISLTRFQEATHASTHSPTHAHASENQPSGWMGEAFCQPFEEVNSLPFLGGHLQFCSQC